MLGGLLQWWYAGGWGMFASSLKDRLRNTADLFSIGILFKTLFAPFRQISAVSSGTSKWQAFLDRLFSRMVGGVVRLLIIQAGIITLVFQAVVGVLLVIIWPLVPFLPIACIVLAVMGVTF